MEKFNLIIYIFILNFYKHSFFLLKKKKKEKKLVNTIIH
jgi:hypothetical protein